MARVVEISDEDNKNFYLELASYLYSSKIRTFRGALLYILINTHTRNHFTFWTPLFLKQESMKGRILWKKAE